MSIQRLGGSCIDGKLALSWILMVDSLKAVAIQVARDSEFTEDLHMYTLPPVTQCFLDTGKGLWFFRAGACSSGKIEWSGIPGAVFVDTQKDPELLTKLPFTVLHTQMITNGIRLHTDLTTSIYAIIDYSTSPKFIASSTKSVYFEDPGRGYFECTGLDPMHTYSIRITTTATPSSSFPKDTIHVMQRPQIFNGKKALAPTKPHDFTDQALRKKAARLIQEATESKKPIRFSSSQDYAMYLAAKTASQSQRF